MVDLRKRGFADKIIGVDTNMHHQNIAFLCGLVHENDTLDNAIEKSDLIILSTPVNTNCIMLPVILDRLAGTSKIIRAAAVILRYILWRVRNIQVLWQL